MLATTRPTAARCFSPRHFVAGPVAIRSRLALAFLLFSLSFAFFCPSSPSPAITPRNTDASPRRRALRRSSIKCKAWLVCLEKSARGFAKAPSTRARNPRARGAASASRQCTKGSQAAKRSLGRDGKGPTRAERGSGRHDMALCKGPTRGALKTAGGARVGGSAGRRERGRGRGGAAD